MNEEGVLIDYLSMHGEKINAEIKIEGMTSNKVASILARLIRAKKLERRQVEHKSKFVWCYRLQSDSFKEPDYAFILRNLPRAQDERHGEPSPSLHLWGH
jgi:hypothetical protein